jgi:hypothetical protein
MLQKSLLKLLLLLLLGVFIASSCSTKRKATERKVSVCLNTVDGSEIIFPDGKYYAFRFDETTISIVIEPETVLKSLTEAGIHWEEAWYKAPARMCVPPGSEIGMMVIVEPAFVVRTAGKVESIAAYGFIETQEPGLGECAFVVQHFVQTIE